MRRARDGWAGPLPLVVVVAGCVGGASIAGGAERCVLGEFLTWSNCGPCAEARPVVSSLIDQYGPEGSIEPGRLAIVEIPLWDQYQQPWGAAREAFYAPIFSGTPCFVHDGMYDAWPISTYVSKFMTRRNKPTPVTMSIDVVENAIDDYQVTVEVCLEADADALDLRIYTVLVEDHYPQAVSSSRNTFRVAAPTEDLALEPGDCRVVTKTLGVMPYTQQASFKIVAWAQDANDSWPAEVHQSTVALYPFSMGCEGDLDGGGDIGFGDLLAILSAWGPCEACPEDINGYGGVDFADLLFVISHWGPCS